MQEVKSTVLKVTVSQGGWLCKMDGIEYDGKLWLVPHWLDTPDGKWTMPTRIIRFDNLDHQDVRGTGLGDYVVSMSMPKELFDERTPKPPVAGYEYLELPDICIRRA